MAAGGPLPGMVGTGATFTDAAAEYLRYIEQDRGRQPSTPRGDRSAIEAHLLPEFGELPVEDVTRTAIEQVEAIESNLGIRQLRLVLAWAEPHREELLENWRRARAGETLLEIDPLQ
jgi:Domain of unknown function (DUF4160)/Phage integrase, N-terminal SAM-like domain